MSVQSCDILLSAQAYDCPYLTLACSVQRLQLCSCCSVSLRRLWYFAATNRCPRSADTLRRLYPKHSLVMSQQLGVLNYPGLAVEPLEKTPLTTNLYFAPLSKRLAGIPGLLVDQVEFGAFRIRWNVCFTPHDLMDVVLTLPPDLRLPPLHRYSEQPRPVFLLI